MPTNPLAVAASLPKPLPSARLHRAPSLKRTPLWRARMSMGMNPPPVLLSNASSKSFLFLDDIGWEKMTMIPTFMVVFLRHNEGWDRLAVSLGLSGTFQGCYLRAILDFKDSSLWILVSENNIDSCSCSSSPKPSQYGINWVCPESPHHTQLKSKRWVKHFVFDRSADLPRANRSLPMNPRHYISWRLKSDSRARASNSILSGQMSDLHRNRCPAEK